MAKVFDSGAAGTVVRCYRRELRVEWRLVERRSHRCSR